MRTCASPKPSDHEAPPASGPGTSARTSASPVPTLDVFRRTARRRRLVIVVLAVVLSALVVAASCVGASSVGPSQVGQAIAHALGIPADAGAGAASTGVTGASAGMASPEAQDDADASLRGLMSIVFDVRLPRVICAVLAGGALALAGLLMQGIFRNPLVSPYTLGVSDGASLGASIAIVCAGQLAAHGLDLGRWLTPLFAFLMALVAMGLVYAISRVVRGSTSVLVLSGVAVGYLFSAGVSTIKYLADGSDLPELVFWRMGNLMGLRWDVAAILAMVLAVAFVLAMRRAWDLNALVLGREEATALGVNYRRVQTLTFVLATVLTATAVSFTGIIGFVGLVAPHVARILVGNDHRYSIPAALLFGAILMLAADTLARTLFAPTELPVGIVTSFIGVPFFLYLIVRRRRI